MRNAHIAVLIDLQNGFSRFDIPQKEGGCLYVPGGENAAGPAADLIARSKHGIFILSQDFHPSDHVSFMENHKGVMELRRELVKMHHGITDVEEAILDPRIMPFTDILLKKEHAGYVPVGCKVGHCWRKVDTNFFHEIVHISSDKLTQTQIAGTVEQKLWRRHCVQGTRSAAFDERIMAVLPEDLKAKLASDIKSPVLKGTDDNGNLFFVIRKGMHRDLDSYGIATENDGIAQTQAPALFAELAEALRKQGVTHVDIDIGGLATNFCAELSEVDLHKHLVPVLREAGIGSRVHFLTDISYGIPLATPDGSWPDLEGTEKRMYTRGVTPRTTEDVLRSGLRPLGGWLQFLEHIVH